jgi:hypothetical protein
VCAADGLEFLKKALGDQEHAKEAHRSGVGLERVLRAPGGQEIVVKGIGEQL